MKLLSRSWLLSALLVPCSQAAHGAPHHAPGRIPDRLAIQAIIGEAANQSDLAMLAVAGAIRNRGTLAGVYGLTNPMASHPSRLTWTRAARAWAQSARLDLAAGCRYFGCPADATYFRSLHFHPVKTIGEITFYKP